MRRAGRILSALTLASPYHCGAKIYDLAYFGQGDILILGLGQGFAAGIVTQAVFDAGRLATIVGVDEEARVLTRVKANLAAYNFTSRVELVQENPARFCRARSATGQTFGMVYVNHSADSADVLSISALLPSVVAEGGIVLFHDINDRRNKGIANGGYGMYSGVQAGLSRATFAFYGAFGCTGLSRREATTSTRASLDDAESLIPRVP